jgi:hypothetical protein
VDERDMNQRVIYEQAVHVRNSPGSSMPSKFLGASVVLFIVARRGLDFDTVLELIESELEEQSLEFKELIGGMSMIEIDQWDMYLDGRWGDLPHGLPSSLVFLELEQAEVYFSPFGCYERERME